MKQFILAPCLAALLAAAAPAVAGTISDPSDSFTVGVGTNGELYDFGSGIGFQRVSDGFDPLAPGTPRDSWGITDGTASAWGDQAYVGAVNVTSVTTYGANSANVVSTTGLGLNVTQNMSFLSPNVLAVSGTVTNVSDAAAATNGVLFQRVTDWDVSPTAFDERTSGPYGPNGTPAVVDSTYFGFENPDPNAGGFSSSCASGCDNTGDLGGGIRISLGDIAVGSATSFEYLYAINQSGQSPADLLTQLQSLGSYYTIMTESSDGSGPLDGTNAASISVASSSATPEPGTAVLGLGSFLLIGLGAWRRKKA